MTHKLKGLYQPIQTRRIGPYIFELIHDQLPLAVPCYDLVPVTKFTLGHAMHRLRAPPAPLT